MSDARAVPAAETSGEDYPQIRGVYTMLSRIPVLRDRDGNVYAEDLWALDLREHLNYIPDFRLCCPAPVVDVVPVGWEKLPGFDATRVTPIREDKGWGSVFANLLPNFLTVLGVAQRSDVVHGSPAGWAFSLDYYLVPLRPFLRCKRVFNMESSFWMKQEGGAASLRARISHNIHFFFARACMRHADARLFTQAWYRDQLLGGDTRNTLINEAVWVNDEDVIGDADFAARAADKTGPVRLLYPTRLIAEKGVASVLDAIARVEAGAGPDFPGLVIDVIGAGTMEADVRSFIATHPGKAVTVSFLDPVPYGAPFFSLLAGYDGILVANLAEEQPRILYDSFSQGVPAIASATSGVMQVAQDGETAILYPPGDVEALAARLKAAATDRPGLRAMGERGLAVMRGRTHRAMHMERARFLARCLGQG